MATTSATTSSIESATTTTTSSASASTTTASSSLLAPGTIAGVAIAGIFISLVVFFLLGCLIAYIRRRKLAHQRELYDARNAPQSIGLPPQPPDQESARDRYSGNDMGSQYSQYHKPYPTKQSTGSGHRLNPADVGVAVTSETKYAVSPESVRSTISTTKLLPLRPPEQLRQKLNNRGSHASARMHQRGGSWTVFEEEPHSGSVCSRDSSVAPPPAPLNFQTPSRRISALRPKGSTGPVPRLLFAPPSIDSSPTKAWLREPTTHRRPNSDIMPLSPTYDPRTSPTRRSSISYLPAYYTRRSYFPASPALTEQIVLSPPLPPSKSPPNLPLPPPPAAKATSLPPPPPPKTLRSRSAESNGTSFESVCTDQSTPPAEEYPPVAIPAPLSIRSSNMGHIERPDAGAAEIRYPKVPRSTNQAIPRNTAMERVPSTEIPAAETPQPSIRPPPSLLEKRRGAETARDVENSLWWRDGTNTAQPGAGKGGATFTFVGKADQKRISRKPLAEKGANGKVGVGAGQAEGGAREEEAMQGIGGQRTSEMVMTSPVWQPKLTPTRWLGGEMVIEIS